MSGRNLYAPGNNRGSSSLHSLGSNELSQVMIMGDNDNDASVMLDDYQYNNQDTDAELATLAGTGGTSVQQELSASHNSLDVGDDLDPAALYSLLEQAIPRQTEAGRVLTIAEQQTKREMVEHVWDRVRKWLRRHDSIQERQAAAFIRGQADATPLHLMCKLHNPAPDVVADIVAAAPQVCQWVDHHGWLPLHHACANGASTQVLEILTQAFPEGKCQQDNQNRTPLHFYATRNTDNPAVMAENAELLADSGAAELADRGGMLPMHYACAYGTHPAVLGALAAVSPASLVAKENKGRTPMHLAMVNAHRDASPDVIRFLLAQQESKATVNTRDADGYLPLHLLALGLRGYRADDPVKQANVSECLSMYLDAEPQAGADFLTAIQDLPDWLQDTAVVSKHVRNVLNDRIIQRFPTSILMLDGYWLIIIIVCFELTTRNHINLRFDPDGGYTDDTQVALSILFCGAAYFLSRELVQVISLMALGSLSSWFADPANWLDMGVIVLVTYFGVLMVDDSLGLSNTTFRSGVAFTKGVLWVAVIVYLKSTLVDFAVFVGGVFYVVQKLAAFLIATGVILLAFAQMFYFVYLETDICLPGPVEGDEDFNPLSDYCRFPHCTFEESLLKVYTMMMGEIGDETRYSTDLTAQILYVAYAFLVVILLSNVLIAIVTDSYEIIQNDRAAIVFWSNRLDFVAEMDAITFGIRQRLSVCCCWGKSKSTPVKEEPDLPGSIMNPPDSSTKQTQLFREAWQQVMFLFDANLYDEIDMVEFWVYLLFRIFSIVFLIPLWLALGLLTAGWLWPPQVREFLFVQKETVVSRSELERQKLGQLKTIETDLKTLKQQLMREMAGDRDEMSRMKAEVETVQGEVLTDLLQVKELMASLLGE